MTEVDSYSDDTCRKALAVLDRNPAGLTLVDMVGLISLGLVLRVVEDQEYFLPSDKLRALEGELRRAVFYDSKP